MPVVHWCIVSCLMIEFVAFEGVKTEDSDVYHPTEMMMMFGHWVWMLWWHSFWVASPSSSFWWPCSSYYFRPGTKSYDDIVRQVVK